jgi:hypothetical protein
MLMVPSTVGHDFDLMPRAMANKDSTNPHVPIPAKPKKKREKKVIPRVRSNFSSA